MKFMVWSYVWWFKLDVDFEWIICVCWQCFKIWNVLFVVFFCLWIWFFGFWKRVYVDFVIFEGKYYFILVDVYFKWFEVVGFMRSIDVVVIISVFFNFFI